MPVFYLPILYYPIQEDDRATGILMPMYGSSLATGSSISNAFFWAINRSHDATFFHDWMFSRGNGLGAEYRYVLGPQAQGDFRYYWLDEKEAIDQRPARARRGRASRCAAASARTCRSAWRRGRASTTSPTSRCGRPTITTSTTPRTARARITAASPGRGATCRRTARSSAANRSTNADNSTVTGQAPGFTAALSGVRLGPLPIFATVNAEAGRRRVYIGASATVEQDLSLIKADVTPSIRAPLSTLPYLQVNATAAYRTTYYSESLADGQARRRSKCR